MFYWRQKNAVFPLGHYLASNNWRRKNGAKNFMP
jgi:hypothetical protein